MTSMLSSDQLTAMKAVQNSNLPETAYIQALTKTSDGEGGYTEAWNTVTTTTARIGEPKGELEREIAGRIGAGVTYVITLPSETVLDLTDQIQINGVNYKVHWTNKNKSSKTALRAVVTEA